jgi:hypothetical protein
MAQTDINSDDARRRAYSAREGNAQQMSSTTTCASGNHRLICAARLNCAELPGLLRS